MADTINGTRDQAQVRFARISETEHELQQDRDIITVAEMPKADLLANSGNVSEFRLKWVSLPPDTFNPRVFGAVLLHPQQQGSMSLQNITTCTLSAGWGTSQVSTDWSRTNAYYSVITGVPNSFRTF